MKAAGKSLIARTKFSLWRAYALYYEHSPLRGKFLLGRILRSTIGAMVIEDFGVLYELDPVGLADRNALLNGVHDPTVLDAIQTYLAGGGMFLDVGANSGYFTTIAASIPGVRVLAFEPSPRELSRLYRNIALNRFRNVVVFPFGLSDKNGDFSLAIASQSNPGMNSMFTHGKKLSGRSLERTVSCRFSPLAQLVDPQLLENVRLVKIDVEGAEMNVLRGMRHVFARLATAAFVVEISREWLVEFGSSIEELYRFFADRGFRPTYGPLDVDQYDEIFLPDIGLTK